jgi:DNA-binding transcriptional regulator YiaG
MLMFSSQDRLRTNLGAESPRPARKIADMARSGVMAEETDQTLDAAGPRLRALRKQRGLTLADLSMATGTSESTLSRLESGGRRPTA